MASEKDDVMLPLRQFVDAFNKGEYKQKGKPAKETGFNADGCPAERHERLAYDWMGMGEAVGADSREAAGRAMIHTDWFRRARF